MYCIIWKYSSSLFSRSNRMWFINKAHSRWCLWLSADLCCIMDQCWLSAFWLWNEDILVCKHSGAAKITHQLQMGVIIHAPKFWGAVPAPPLTFPLLTRDDRDGFKGSSSLPAVNSQDYLEGNVASVAEHGNICMSCKDKSYPSHWLNLNLTSSTKWDVQTANATSAPKARKWIIYVSSCDSNSGLGWFFYSV